MKKPDVSTLRRIQPVDQLIVLAGGRGTRLGELTRTTPKPLISIREDGASFLELAIEEYARQGFLDIIVVAGYLGDQIAALLDGRYFGSARVRVITEQEALGTGGALLAAAPLLSERFVVANGDSFIDANLRAFCAAPISPHKAAMLVRWVDDATRYGRVEAEGGIVRKFKEKNQSASGGLINAGVYLFHRSVIKDIMEVPFSLENQLFPQMAGQGRLSCVEATGYFTDIGLPEFLLAARAKLPDVLRRPAVFFDRDGVLNEDSGYVGRREQFRWLPGAIEFVRAVNDAKLRAIVVTNQAGVARGKYGVDDIHTLHGMMNWDLAERGAFIDRFYFCPSHEEGTVKAYRTWDFERKPNPGMILRAQQELGLDIHRSILIGDKSSDIEAARAAGIHGVLVENGDIRAAFIRAQEWLASVGVKLDGVS